MFVRHAPLALTLLVLLVAASSACGGQAATPPPSPTAAFVGTWTCNGTGTEAVSSPPGQPGSITTISQTEIFVANADGTLTATIPDDAGTSGACASTKFSVSGSTATALTGQSCSGGGFTTTIQSETFVVSGTSATSTTSSTLIQVATDGGSGTFTATVTASSTCTLN
jgi:hypothetical protein